MYQYFGTSQKNNLSAVTNPTINDDSSLGYSAGSRWINTATEEEFVCTEAAVGTAIWLSTTLNTVVTEAYVAAQIGSAMAEATYAAGDVLDQATQTTQDGGNISGSVAAIPLDWNGKSILRFTLTGNLTGTFPSPSGLADASTIGKRGELLLILYQDGTGGRTFSSSLFDNLTYTIGDIPVIDTTPTTGHAIFLVTYDVATGPTVVTRIYLGPSWRPVRATGAAAQIGPTQFNTILRTGDSAPVLPLGNAGNEGATFIISNYSGASTTPTTLSAQTFDLPAIIPDGSRRAFQWDVTDAEWKVI